MQSKGHTSKNGQIIGKMGPQNVSKTVSSKISQAISQHLFASAVKYLENKRYTNDIYKKLNLLMKEYWYFWDLGTPDAANNNWRITQSSTPWSRRGGDHFRE